ncbi:uncharacterized protein FIBRA_00145 [Fibroporia radiculosa]|uniref:Uncharacterized protein n=1 Tax=Fibroporia radiculosa TaxID=599839 RepID=J7SBV7_9APHY|nr:uncharacterized protein FIBRA_00145 [Fibroporia radiculosa]CCL98151.1 predicted protein [Fibroporia radiculosa]
MPQRTRRFADIFVTGRPERLDHQVLTPRTPHSRSGRAEEGHTGVELERLRRGSSTDDEDEDDNDSFGSSTSALRTGFTVSSSTSSFPMGYRSRGDDHEILIGPSGFPTVQTLVQRFVMLSGVIMSCGIFVMFVKAFDQISLQAAINMKQRIWHGFAGTGLPPSGRLLSYASYSHFPLTGAEYRAECNKIANFMSTASYWDTPLAGPLDVLHVPTARKGEQNVCSSTITYMLDGSVGLATDLALMAQVAGLARERNSTFFIDDTYWNRGKWTDYFENIHSLYRGPQPGCRAPPPQELVACPRVARHLIVSGQTASFHLSRRYMEEFEDQSAHGVNRQKPIFDRARRSVAEVIRPNAHISTLIQAARAEVASVLSLQTEHASPYGSEPYIGVHIQGRNHSTITTPVSSSLPMAKFIQVARHTWSRLYPAVPLSLVSSSSATAASPAHFPMPPIAYVASDSPEVIRDYVAALPPSTATFSLGLSTNAELRGLAPQHGYMPEDFDKQDQTERVRLTRGAIVDLALLSGLWAETGQVIPSATICAGSSNLCKLSVLGLGWSRSFGLRNDEHFSDVISAENRRWVDIEEGNPDVWTVFTLPP